jgi:predicted transglutaminase-like cysteine proteinase
MTTRTRIASTAILLLASLGAMAQTNTAQTVQRDINQQTRIENGLKDGSLNVKEAGRLESEQARVDRIQANALKDGKLTAAERERLDKVQDKVSQDIRSAKTNDVKGNPNSASNQRMQADVQRKINQDTRIEQGVKSGELRNTEVAKLERGQAHVSRREAAAAKDGHVGAHEQAKVQQAENKQSKKIYNKKHNEVERKG